MEATRLSKGKYCRGRKCLTALYWSVHEPERASEIDAQTQKRFEDGQIVGREARTRYPGGVLITADHLHSEGALQQTAEALAKNPPAIFEAAFLFHQTLVRTDILVNNGDGTWELVEVKSTAERTVEHIPDMAVQRYVVENCGLKIRRTILKHLNSECTYPNLDDLFIDQDCTEDIADELALVPAKLNEMHAVLKQPTAPVARLGTYCNKPYACEFHAQCWSQMPKHSVFELNGVWGSDKIRLYEQGKVLINDLGPTEFVNRSKRAQREAVRSGQPIMDRPGLEKFLAKIEYPIYFFDFETMSHAVPILSGVRPHAQVPFQFSCHILESEGAELRHAEFLADGTSDCRREITDRLLTTLGERGTILAYYAVFEQTRLEELAEYLPDQAEKLLALLPRFVDLMDVFSKHYYHPDFHGSLSIKKVLPVMVPELSYENLEIGNGLAAQSSFGKLSDPLSPVEEKTRIREALLEYCRLDTLAMVELLKRVLKL